MNDSGLKIKNLKKENPLMKSSSVGDFICPFLRSTSPCIQKEKLHVHLHTLIQNFRNFRICFKGVRKTH